MRTMMHFRRCLLGVGVLVLFTGCDTPNLNLDDLGNLIGDLGGGGTGGSITEPNDAAIEVYASNTGGASGMAIRPSDGEIFIVNPDGLFGPIARGADVSQMTPIGATNLADMGLFDQEQVAFVLAVTNDGEFWIASPFSSRLAVVSAQGGDAEPFTGLLEGVEPANIKPEAIVLVPDGFSGPQIKPGNLLVGEDTTFSRLAVIDVATRFVIPKVDNANEETINREAHDLTFGADGVLYSARQSASATLAGIQRIDTDGAPTPLEGTFRVAVNAFVGLADGDLLIDGTFRREGDLQSDVFNGLFFYDAAAATVSEALTLETTDSSERDEMVLAADGTIYLSQPALNRIVVVTDRR
ncbi:MAG: hypothetical protein ACE5E5_08410 [Phycisphaerae bacterium]